MSRLTGIDGGRTAGRNAQVHPINIMMIYRCTNERKSTMNPRDLDGRTRIISYIPDRSQKFIHIELKVLQKTKPTANRPPTCHSKFTISSLSAI